MQDFLRRVEDSIRTSNTTLDRNGCRHHQHQPQEEPIDSISSISPTWPSSQSSPPSLPSPPPPPPTPPQEPVAAAQPMDGPSVDDVDGRIERAETPTFDAGTQTSPMSLSPSSSFLWVSDCNCSGSLDGSVAIVSGPTSRHSEAGSSGVSRIVHMDTSMSSLISESSAGQHVRPRRRGLATPDSANEDDGDDDDDDDDGRSSVSLSRSIDGGANGGGGGGTESGIGTGSPPPRDRRRRPIPHDLHPEVSVQTAIRRAESDESDLAVGDEDDDQETEEEEDEPESSCSSSVDDEADAAVAAAKKREKVRRRETWEKIRRRHSCKRVHSRTRTGKDKPEVVWIRRGQSQTPPPPPVPPHAVPVGSAPVMSTLLTTDVLIHPLLEPSPVPSPALAPKVLHKPPVVIIQSVPSRPKPRPLLFKNISSDGSGLLSLDLNGKGHPHHQKQGAGVESSGVKMALQSVLSMELSSSKSSSTPFLIVGGGGGGRHLKPISASSTPTEPYVTLEVRSLSHYQSCGCSLELSSTLSWM